MINWNNVIVKVSPPLGEGLGVGFKMANNSKNLGVQKSPSPWREPPALAGQVVPMYREGWWVTFKKVCILLLLIWTNEKIHAQTFTLDYCIEKAIANSIQVKRSQLNQENARANSHQSKAQLLPTLSASANHSYNFGRNINPVTNTFQENNIQGNQFRLDGILPIFNGLQTQFRILETKSNLKASKEEVKQSKNEIMLVVISAYLQVLFNTELLKAAQWQYDNSKAKTLQKEQSVSAGVSPQSQLLEMKSLVATDELNMTIAENNLALSKLDLIQIMLLPSETQMALTMPETELLANDSTENTDELYTSSLSFMPAPKQYALLTQSAKYREYSAKNARLPRLNLYGGVLSNYAQVLGQPNYYPFTEQINNNLGQYVSLSLNVPILNAWQTKTNIQAAVINRKNAELNAVEVQINLRKEIEKYYLNKRTAYKKYMATEKQAETQRENFRMSEHRLEAGAMDLVEYGTVKNNLAKAESDYIRAKYDYMFKTKILEFYKAPVLE